MEKENIERELRKLTNLPLSINQLKVINDKYLKESPTVEEWLKKVCHNIALSEILHSENIKNEEIFEGVNHEIIEEIHNGKTSKMILLHKRLYDSGLRKKNFNKFIENLEKISRRHPEIIKQTEEKFYGLLSSFDFFPLAEVLMCELILS